jgi:hypothetical protein
MYKLYLISYSGSYATSVKDTIKTFGAWFNHFENQFLLCTTKDLDTVKDKLDTKINQGQDKLLVMEIKIVNAKGWLNKDGWEWLRSQKDKLQ